MPEYKDFHLFCGSGGAALGFREAVSEYRGMVGRFRCLGGVDVDPEACEDFRRLVGAPAAQLDLFTRADYAAFHGHEPPAGWREATPEDLRAAAGHEYPDVVFLSPPCKGFSGLLPSKKAASEKYQALNRLVIRGLKLTLEAFADDLPAVIMLENVPRITSRGAGLLKQVKRLLGTNGYLFHEGFHDCGEIGGLGQHRKRYLLIARLPEKMTSFIYKPPQRRVKSIGEIIGPLPLPDDPGMGPMHRLPRLKWLTWVRLALIPAGGDWRDLEKIAPEQYRLEYVPREGAYRVQEWNRPSTTITGAANASRSNSATCIADPRLPERDNRHPAVYQVIKWDEAGPCVTGTRFGSGAPAVADPRLNPREDRRSNSHLVRPWDGPAYTVTGEDTIGSGAQSVADPRLGCKPRGNTKGPLGVQSWDETSSTVFGSMDVHSGPAAVADPRIPADNDRPDPPPVIIALDGTWHRPLTTLELAALQGFPVVLEDGSPLVLAGKSDARWRERVGNAVPPPAARAIAEQILTALLVSERGEWTLGATGVWVKEVHYERQGVDNLRHAIPSRQI
ncbi:MAG: DNA cytosine methyltransferase [Peptococcaceae bacterium]|nr:DNA cytosine methyltransferase [Peptococcaceae bacterium]